MASSADNSPAIEVRELVKRYQKAKTNAVDGVSFQVRRGEIFGLLGPNGAGKTTTIGVLITSVVPTSGSCSVMGIDVARDPIAVKQRIAVVPQQSNLDRSIRVREILTFHAAYHSVGRKAREERADKLSGAWGRHPLLGRMYLPAYRAGTDKVAALRRTYPAERVLPAIYGCYGMVDIMTIDEVLRAKATPA